MVVIKGKSKTELVLKTTLQLFETTKASHIKETKLQNCKIGYCVIQKTLDGV